MSAQKCKKCSSSRLETIEEINSKTKKTDIISECLDCGHEDQRQKTHERNVVYMTTMVLGRNDKYYDLRFEHPSHKVSRKNRGAMVGEFHDDSTLPRNAFTCSVEEARKLTQKE